MPVVQHHVLRGLSFDIFKAAGIPDEDSQLISDHLVDGDLYGHESHGVWRVARYVESAAEGYVPWDEHEVVRENRAMAVIDGRGANGVVALTNVAEIAVRKAGSSTIAAVGVHGLSHVGRLGDYPRRIAEEGMVGIVWSNVGGVFVAPFGSADRRLGPNPIAFAVPRRHGPPFVLDMSLSVVAGTRARQKIERNEPVPEGWLIDQQGNYATDARQYEDPDVGVLPLGGLQFGHKGHGLSMMIEMIVGPLSLAGCTTGMGPAQGLGAGKNGGGVLVLAIDIAQFTDLETYKDQIEAMASWVNSANPLPGVDRLYAPGERGDESYRRTLREGVNVPEATWDKLSAVASELGVDMPKL